MCTVTIKFCLHWTMLLPFSSSITVPFPFHSGSSNKDLYLLRDEVLKGIKKTVCLVNM